MDSSAPCKDKRVVVALLTAPSHAMFRSVAIYCMRRTMRARSPPPKQRCSSIHTDYQIDYSSRRLSASCLRCARERDCAFTLLGALTLGCLVLRMSSAAAEWRPTAWRSTCTTQLSAPLVAKSNDSRKRSAVRGPLDAVTRPASALGRLLGETAHPCIVYGHARRTAVALPPRHCRCKPPAHLHHGVHALHLQSPACSASQIWQRHGWPGNQASHLATLPRSASGWYTYSIPS